MQWRKSPGNCNPRYALEQGKLPVAGCPRPGSPLQLRQTDWARPQRPPSSLPSHGATSLASVHGPGRAQVPFINMHRILDANWNRAAEGCRVVEDFARFELRDAQLSSRYKTLRHDLRTALEDLDSANWIRCRDAAGDVGAALTHPGEQARGDARSVSQASQKRLEQALRCLEEYVKILSPKTALRLEQLRYQAYDLGRRLSICALSQQRLDDRRLYVLVDGGQDLPQFTARCEAWLAAGADILQLRDKSLSDKELLERAQSLSTVARRLGKLAIVNDRVDIAAAAGADGVHLGQDDLPIAAARRALGPTALIGRSTHSLQQALEAVEAGADYLGYGPTFASGTKAFAESELTGLAFLREASQQIGLPGFAIGGIHAGNLADVIATGVHGAAVSGAVHSAPAPIQAISQLRAMFV